MGWPEPLLAVTVPPRPATARLAVALLAVLAVVAAAPLPAPAASPSTSRVRVELLSEVETVAPGVAWLTTVSSAPGEQGHVSAAQADQLTASRGAAPTLVLLDPTGVVGKAYGATNTPHMYVIDRAGVLAYAGAIDDRPSTRKSDVPGAQNYVRAAVQAVAAGQPVKTPVTRAYGCTVKCS